MLDGVEQGPLSSDDLKSMIADGVLARTAHVCKSGMSKWITADEFLQSLEATSKESPLSTLVETKNGQSPSASKPILVQEHHSIWKSLWTSFMIGRKKAARHKLVSVDLRKAQLALGESAFRHNLFRDHHADTYEQIDAIIKNIANNQSASAARPMDTLSKDITKQLVKSKHKIQSALLKSELQTALINFAELLRKEHYECELLTSEFAHVDAVSKEIVLHDQQLMDYSRNASFLVRHPSLLFGSVILSILLLWVTWSYVAYRRVIAQAYSDAHSAAARTTRQIEANQNRLQRQRQAIQQQQMASQIKFNEMMSNNTEKQIALENRRIANQEKQLDKRDLAAANKEIEVEQKQEQEDQEQLIRSNYAAQCFSQFTFAPAVLASSSLGNCSITIEGAKYNAIQGLFSSKDWLGLIHFLNPHHQAITGRRGERDMSRRAEDAARNVPTQSRDPLEKYPAKAAIDEAVNNLLRSEFTLYLQSTWIPRKPIFIVLLDDEGFLPLDLAKNVARHPTKPGWIVTCPCRIKTLIALVGTNSFNIQREIQPFNSHFEERRRALNSLRSLGELTDDGYSTEIEKERNLVFERFKAYLTRRPAQY